MAALLVLLACTGTPPDGSGGELEVIGGPGGAEAHEYTPEEEAAAYVDFYADETVHELRFTLSDDVIDAINQDVRQAQRGIDTEMEWQDGDVEIDGVAFSHVGVRAKGSSTLDDFDGKPSLKIKLNHFVAGQTWAGLERLTLNNDVEDASQLRQVLVYRILREAGRRAPHANHALVYVNDELYGLYTNVEVYDDRWLGRNFEDDSGELWEGNDYCDFTRQGVSHWESVSGAGDVATLEAVADAIVAPGGFTTSVDAVVNLDDFLHFWAWRVMVGDVDGYPQTQNDVYIYGDPGDGGRFVFFPWGVDESWNTRAPAYWDYATGELATACMADSTCEAAYREALHDVLDQYAGLDVASLVEAEVALTEDLVADDPRQPWSERQVESSREELESATATFPEEIRTAAEL